MHLYMQTQIHRQLKTFARLLGSVPLLAVHVTLQAEQCAQSVALPHQVVARAKCCCAAAQIVADNMRICREFPAHCLGCKNKLTTPRSGESLVCARFATGKNTVGREVVVARHVILAGNTRFDTRKWLLHMLRGTATHGDADKGNGSSGTVPAAQKKCPEACQLSCAHSNAR